MFVTRPFFFSTVTKHKHCLILTQIAHFSNPPYFFSQVRFQQRKSHRSRRRQSSRSTSRRRQADYGFESLTYSV